MELLDRLVIFMEITLINLLLSGDNAVVIAMAGRRLPAAQRRMAVWWGAAAAVVLRCVLTLGAVAMLGIPFLQTAGALLLFVIAIQLMTEHEEVERSKPATNLAGAIWTIVTADFIMSLDNVLAVAAVAEGDIVMIIIGIAMSIPMIIWGSAFIMRMLDRLPGLAYIGGALLAYTAGEMLLHDRGLQRALPPISDDVAMAVPFGTAALLLTAALCLRRKRG
ncbi:TerC family protein [Cohnella pontilimi]|uniref:TerC family protein n=1 Tax=Cohnella pontilimi TaxID=2564100 RepID=A0A4U0FEZ7_9BACL|nr:TerC family protein [Cohnella pontilimi]TJY43401.1 TerC family protein [Cohnella pontilimi]